MSKNRLGSTNSIHSNAGSVPRVNTVTNVLRRFFSRDESRSPNTPDGKFEKKSSVNALKKQTQIFFEFMLGSLPTPPLNHSSSTISMAGPKYPQGTMRIADQIIEEVDEQLTVTSNRGHNEKRPTAQSLFAPNNEKPVRSQPIDVPHSHRNNIEYERVQSVMHPEHTPYLFPNDTIFSSSAPEDGAGSIPLPKINIDKSVEFKDIKRSKSGSTDKIGRKIVNIQFF